MSIPEPREISTPGALTELLKDIKQAVAAGELTQLRPSSEFETQVAVNELAADGPWPDYIELHFRETKGGLGFRLVVETYHGSGGAWEVER